MMKMHVASSIDLYYSFTYTVWVNMLFTNLTLTFLSRIQSKTSQLRALLLSRLRIRDKRGKVTHRKQINKGKKKTHTHTRITSGINCTIVKYARVERESAFLLLIKRRDNRNYLHVIDYGAPIGRSVNVASVSIARPGYTSRLPRRQKGVLPSSASSKGENRISP